MYTHTHKYTYFIFTQKVKPVSFNHEVSNPLNLFYRMWGTGPQYHQAKPSSLWDSEL